MTAATAFTCVRQCSRYCMVQISTLDSVRSYTQPRSHISAEDYKDNCAEGAQPPGQHALARRPLACRATLQHAARHSQRVLANRGGQRVGEGPPRRWVRTRKTRPARCATPRGASSRQLGPSCTSHSNHPGAQPHAGHLEYEKLRERQGQQSCWGAACGMHSVGASGPSWWRTASRSQIVDPGQAS